MTDNNNFKSDLLEELEAIKKLLAINLLRNGASQEEVALALDVHRTTVGRMFPSDVINEPED